MDVQGIDGALTSQPLLALGEGAAEKRIAVGSKHDVPRLEVEGYDAHMALVHGKSIYDTVCLVLLAHGLEHAWNDGLSGSVIVEKVIPGSGAGSNDGSALFGQLLLVGLGVVVIVVANETLTVAHHPNLASQSAEDDAAGCEAVFGMIGEMGQAVVLIALADGLRRTDTKLMGADVLGHLTDKGADGEHGQLAVGVRAQREVTMTLDGALRGGAVDDCYEVIGDDDSVLASLRGILRDDFLLDDGHGWLMLDGGRGDVESGWWRGYQKTIC